MGHRLGAVAFAFVLFACSTARRSLPVGPIRATSGATAAEAPAETAVADRPVSTPETVVADPPSSAPGPTVEGPPPAPIEPTAAVTEPVRDPRDTVTRPDLGGGRVLSGVTAHRMVLFTFDDGPHPFHTRVLLGHLERAEVRGVFFVNAHRFDAETGWYAECADVLRETAAAGHVLASHGRDHEPVAHLRGASLDDQVAGAEDIFLRVVGVRPWLFRPPGGLRSEDTDAYLAARGYTQVLWTLRTADTETRDAETVLRNFRASIVNREATGTPGGIAVIHDTHPWGVAAFPRMVRWLRRRNCELLERGEELYDLVDDPALFYSPRAPGEDPSAEAPPIVLPEAVWAERQRALRERETERCRDE